MNFLYSGCITRRLTRTVMVLSILSLVTRPVRTRLGIALLLSGLRGGAGFLRQNGLHARDFAPNLLHSALALVLAGRTLKAQVELLLAQVQQHAAQFVGRLRPHVARFAKGCLGHLRRP